MEPRVLLFTGKGGVGKTTIAAATAIKAANLGYETLIMSTDPAHSLSDSFQKKIGPEPTQLNKNLYAMEVNVEHELKKHWEVIKNYLVLFFKSQGIDDIISEELAIFPGFDEFASLLNLLNFYENEKYDVIILDCAPTGQTLRLLSVPEVAKWYMNRLFGIERKVLKVVKPIVEPIVDVPLPTDEVLDKIQELYIKIGKVKEILEKDKSTVRLVMNPERMVIKESERAFTYLNLFGYKIDCVIVNKILPENVDKYFSEWYNIQNKYLREIRERFPVPIFEVKLRSKEVVGNLLHELANELYSGRDPTDVFYLEKPINILKRDDKIIMEINTPFTVKEEINLYKRGKELIIILGNWKRIVFLPESLALRDAVGARFKNGKLEIIFS